MPRIARAVAAVVLGWLLPAPWAMASVAPKVVVTIAPIHSLIAGVMAGVAEPKLLVRGGASPHAYALRPSDGRALAEADLVFWVGEELERFMTRPLAALGAGARLVTLAEAPGLDLLPVREGGGWELHDGETHADSGPGRVARDMHLWLDPVNAQAMVRAAVSALSDVDAAHAAAYRANGDALIARLEGLDRALRAELAPVRGVPYVVFHDAYQYFERRYGLGAVGSVTVSPARQPGAKRVREMRDKILATGAACVFTEPQFAPGLAAALVAGSPARLATLDPVGAALEPGPEAYFQLLEELARSLRRCLAREG